MSRDLVTLSAPTATGVITNNGTNAATFTANAGQPAGTITYNIVSGVAGSTCTGTGSLATPACLVVCPTATIVANGTGSVCSGGGTATLATWQTSVAAANATGLVYSSVTPVAGTTLPNGTLPSGTIPAGCASVNQTVSAYVYCDVDGSSTINAGDTYTLVSTYTLTVFPAIAAPTSVVSGCAVTITGVCPGDLVTLSAPTATGVITNNGTNAATFTANAGQPAGTITYNIVSGVAGSTCTGTGSLATPACPLTCTNPTVLTVNSCIGAGTVTFTQTGGTTSGTWSVSGGGTIDPASGVFTPSTPGCFIATYTTPTGGCTDTESFVVFPSLADITVNSTCNTSLTLPTVPAVTGFNKVWTITAPGGSATTYNTDAAASAALTNTPGAWTISVAYQLEATCGSTLINASSSATACDPVSVIANINPLPAAPVLTPIVVCSDANMPALTSTCSNAVADFSNARFTFDVSSLAPTYTGSGVVATAALGSGISAPSYFGGNPGLAVSATGWNSTAVDNNDYVEVCITPVSDCYDLNITGFSFDYRRSATGPQSIEVRYSQDGFTTFTSLSSFSGFADSQFFGSGNLALNRCVKSGNLCFRIYGYNGTAAGGTLRLDNITISGTSSVIRYNYYLNSITGTLLASNVASYTPTTTLATSPQTICVEAVETGVCTPLCKSAASCTTVTVIPVPVITVANSCAGGSTATFTQTGGPAGGTWTVSGGGTIGATTGVFTPTTAGCFTATYTTPTGNCSDTKSFVVFPAAPAAPVVSNTCNTAITVPALTAVTGFTAQYSFDNGSTWGTSPVSPTTTGCYTIKTRYVTNACGTILAGTVAPAACSESVASNAVIFLQPLPLLCWVPIHVILQ
ncbi:MAG: hypothetical protein IPN89_04595 [Saprospiraceae bacterium]|nr:hypothetical protein [Saprospiraceae bacterium]